MSNELIERLKAGVQYVGGLARPNITGANATMTEGAQAIADLTAERDALREALENPKKYRHRYWGAGESDCPPELKAGNGELHTLRCKLCGDEDATKSICLVALKGE